MSARTPIVLLVVASLLLAYVLLFEKGRPGRKEIEARTGLLLEAVIRERITRVRIASGDDRVVLRREGEGFDETWTIEEPQPRPADANLIEDYLRNWEFAVPVRTLQNPSAEDILSFGIDTPKAEITFEMGPAKTRISLGSGMPVDGGGYLRIDDGQAVTVVAKDVVALFERSGNDFALKDDAGAPDLSDLSDALGAEPDAAPAAP